MEDLPPPPPACFVCPISLEVMRDPVSLCTGVSYERSNIERWLQDGHNICPSTSQKLSTQDLIPNHTLRRLIDQWHRHRERGGVDDHRHCHSKVGVLEEIKGKGIQEVKVLIAGAAKIGAPATEQLDILKRLRALARASARNSRSISECEDAISVLSSILASHRISAYCREEALGILVLLPMSAAARRKLASGKNLIESTCAFLHRGYSIESRINAAALLESLVISERDLKILAGGTANAFADLVDLLHSRPAAMASLRALMALCSPRRNKIRAVESGLVEALVQILPRVTDTATCENAMAVLEMTCHCAEGRAALCGIERGISVVAGKILAVSDAATEYAIRTLWAICKHSYSDSIQRRVVEAGVVAKLLLMLQMDFSSTTKHKFGALLNLLANIHRHCPDVALQDRIQL